MDPSNANPLLFPLILAMKTLSVRFSLMATLFIFTLMLIIGATLGMFCLHRANESLVNIHDIADETRDINDIYKDTSRTRSALMRVYSDMKETGKAPSENDNLALAQKYLSRSQKALQAFVLAAKTTSTDAELRQSQVAAASKLITSLNKAIDALGSGDISTYTKTNSQDVAVEGAAFSKLLDRFQQQSTELSTQLMAQSDGEYRTVRTLVALGIAFALALTVGIHFFLKNSVLGPLERAARLLDGVAHGNLTEPVPNRGETEIGRLMGSISRMQSGLAKTVSDVREGAYSISQVAQEVANGNADLSVRTEAQASSLEETAASMEELTSTVQQTAERTQQARELVHAASGKAVASSEVIGQMAVTMTAIDESSRKVGHIIAVIEGISFQTNILALNAAVEAARAGDHGRGFAVVASEVRTLAQRSAIAANEIRSLIKDSIEKVHSGNQLVETVGRAMSDMASSVQKVENIVVDIAEVSREQSIGISQVSQAIAQIDDITQSNAALVEQAAAATQMMNEQTKNLIKSVSVFTLTHEGTSTSIARRPGTSHRGYATLAKG